MGKTSAGILVYRFRNQQTEIFLAHPGGPYWTGKDLNAWTIPKGEFETNEPALDAANREFKEEIGIEISGNFHALTPIVQKSGKTLFVWAVEKDSLEGEFKSNLYKIEWPPKSGIQNEFPEIDQTGWFSISCAREKIHAGQLGFIDSLVDHIQERKID